MESPKPGEYITLFRGGYLIDSSEGYIQVGSPPETIKDTMAFPKSVPEYYILPNHFFNRTKGISVAEVEFPLYYNFFFRKKKTTLICSKAQSELFKLVLNESLFGPDHFNLQNEFDEKSEHPIPDLKAEIAYFRGPLQLDMLVAFKIFDEQQEVHLGKVTIKMTEKNDFEITDPAFHPSKVTLPGVVEYQMQLDIGSTSNEPFQPPTFGVTCLGPSHGFDPVDNTSGFILWINKRGVMVDPPVNSTEWLKKSGVNPKLTDTIIMTHNHADHDAGTMQKILEGDLVTIYTTQTVMDGWLRKYSALTGIPPKELITLFNFHPVLIGQKINIHGAWFEFHYSLHSLPTMGFKFFYRDKSFVYSSDHLNFPEKHKELFEKGIISRARYEELSHFPWDADIIYHEAGVPPLHTPISYLNTLPVEVQKKITCYHISRKDFPKETHLKLATFGIANSLIVDVPEGSYESAFRILDILSRVEVFQEFSIEQTRDLVAVVNHEKIGRGTQIITKGTLGDKFYIILSGDVRIGDGSFGGEAKKYGNYQTFGEVSLILNKPRTADVFADTDVEALTISKNAFLNLIEDTEIERKLKHVALNRDMETWEALQATTLFEKLNSSQKTDLEVILERVDLKEDRKIFNKNESVSELFIFHSGEAITEDENGKKIFAKKGDFLGDYKEFQLNAPSSSSCLVKKRSIIFRLGAEAFRKFIKKNPGVYLRFFETLTR